MLRKSLIALACIILITLTTKAQDSLKQVWGENKKQWSLLECINYAHENNITIQRQAINTEYQENVLKQSKRNQLPDLNASIGAQYNSGFNWTENGGATLSNSQRYNSNLSSNVSVFEGLNKQNTIKRNKVDLLAALEDMEKTKNDIGLQITGHYLQILFNKELLNVAKEQYETSQLQMDRTKKLVDAGSQAMGSYLEIKSQAAKEALNVTQQENALAMSLLSLAQLLDLERPIEFDIETPELPELNAFTSDLPRNVYSTALEIMPEIKSANYKVSSSEYDLKIAKSYVYPSLSIGANYGTSAYFLEGATNGAFEDQWKDNRGGGIGATLRIPIFNKLQARNGIANAKLSVLDAQYQLKQEKLTLRKSIQQAYADAMAAYNNFLSSQEAVNSFAESFRYTEKKFNVGLVNSVDYNVAKTDFTRAQSDLLQSKYEYILRTKILDFYKGIPIEL
ncbi:TolC family protein [Carboxylicivirga taeanensis]|uniref:TolC family protein n=1 Tax=Carboxylicivirga taeanensis TaxID=1416875 RepID=UPI003F6DAD23